MRSTKADQKTKRGNKPALGIPMPADCKGQHGERFRSLGDLLQSAQHDNEGGPVKRLALVQTPGFVGEFLLDRTLSPALEQFGLDDFRLIDPTCGTGHLLCQAFDRLFAAWREQHPELSPLDCARNAVRSVNGVDYDPTCVAIAKFRLTVAACDAAGVLPYDAAAWGFQLNVAWGDSLLIADDPLQPYFTRSSSFVPGYGEYITRGMGGGDQAKTDALIAWRAVNPFVPLRAFEAV